MTPSEQKQTAYACDDITGAVILWVVIIGVGLVFTFGVGVGFVLGGVG
jgi:hypothetical protein